MKFSLAALVCVLARCSNASSTTTRSTDHVHLLMYDTDASKELKKPDSPLSFLQQRINDYDGSDLKMTMYGDGLDYRGFGDKYQTVRPLLEMADPNTLIVLADSRDTVLNIPASGDTTDDIYLMVSNFVQSHRRLTAQTPNAVVVSAEGQCCVSAMSHASPGDYFDAASGQRNKRACMSGSHNCAWSDNANINAWVGAMQERAGVVTGRDHVDDPYLNAGLMVGYPMDLIRLIDLMDIDPAEDDQAVLSGLMYEYPDKVVLDYNQELFGNNEWTEGEVDGCVYESSSSSLLQPLVHIKEKTQPLIIHTSGKFYGCLDLLLEALGGGSQHRYERESYEALQQRQLRSLFGPPRGFIGYNGIALKDEEYEHYVNYGVPSKFVQNYGVTKSTKAKQDADARAGNYGQYGQYGNYGQYGQYGQYGSTIRKGPKQPGGPLKNPDRKNGTSAEKKNPSSPPKKSSKKSSKSSKTSPPDEGPTDAPTTTWAPSSTFAPSDTFAPTTTWAPTLFPTEIEETDPPTETPTSEPTESFYPSSAPTDDIAETSGVVTGLAAPGPSPARTEDISTVAEFEEVLDAEMISVLGVPESSSCIVESSAIQYAATNLVCTNAFTADQLTGSFCYSFQTTISPPTPDDGNCEVNASTDLVTEELEAGRFAGAIGSVIDISKQLATTNSPTSVPTPGEEPTDAPTSGDDDDDDEPTDAPTSGDDDDDDEPTDAPTSGDDDEPTDAPTSGDDDDDDEPTDAPTSGDDDDDDEPTDAPTSGDDDEPTDAPTSGDDDEPTDAPTSGDDDIDEPTDAPTSGDDEPTDAPTSGD